MNDIKFLHITHNDADGVGCGYIAYLFLTGCMHHPLSENDQINHITKFCSLRTQDEILEDEIKKFDESAKLDENTIILISDLSISDKSIEMLESIRENKGVTLLGFDHHKSNNINVDWFNVVKEKCYDYDIKDYVDISATEVMFNYFMLTETYSSRVTAIYNIDSLKTIVKMISRYDTWEWKNHNYEYNFDTSYDCSDIKEDIFSIATRFFNPYKTYEIMINETRKIENAFERKKINIPSEFIEIYDTIKDKEAYYNLFIVNKARMYEDKETGWLTAMIISENDYSNSAADYLYNTFRSIDIVKIIYPTSNTLGFRTKNPDINLSECVVSKYGKDNAGGHKSAAGAKNLSNDEMAQIMSTFYASKTVNEFYTK